MMLLQGLIQEGDAGGLDLSSDCQKGTTQTQGMFKRAKSLKTSSWGW